MKEVEKRPIIYDKSLRAVANCQELVTQAFDDISTEIEDVMKVQVPGKIFQNEARILILSFYTISTQLSCNVFCIFL